MKKFFGVIGNPPYQEDRETTKDMPIYNLFMDAAYQVGESVLLITPGRFLFNAGATPKPWNQMMLSDPHLKVVHYELDSSKFFSGTSIKGGIAITYRCASESFEPIGVFSQFAELEQIKRRVAEFLHSGDISSIMYPYSTYTLSEAFWNDFPERRKKVEYISKHRNELTKEEKMGELSNFRIITTNIFDLVPEIFFEEEPQDGQRYIRLLGRLNNQRAYRYVLKRYVDAGENLNKWKVIVPASNGSGALGEVLSTPLIGEPLIGEPLIGYTQSFLGIGAFDSEQEALACLKYIKGKFSRALLGILKITQHNPPEKWIYVPLQDFTSRSDIDWSQSVADIDCQLYAKYGLSDDEIDFIETHVKEME